MKRINTGTHVLRKAAFFCLVLAVVSTSTAKPSTRDASAEIPEVTKQQLVERYGKLPLSFEVNRGQTATQVKFLARGSGYSLFLTPIEAVLALRAPQVHPKKPVKKSLSAASTQSFPKTSSAARSAVVHMQLVGANPTPKVIGEKELPGKSHYFVGNDSKKWCTNIPHYAKVRYQNVYTGIDLVYRGNQRQLEYDFMVAPGANPEAIRLAFRGVEKLSLDREGNLVLQTKGGQIVQHAPKVSQEVNGKHQAINTHYVLKENHQVSFQVAAYDVTRPLVIDPVLSYSTYLGGSSNDSGSGIAVDRRGNAYVTGSTFSLDFPTENPLQTDLRGLSDVFVVQLSSRGDELVYATYLGGSGEFGDSGTDIVADSAGNAYVTGVTTSRDFPTTEDAFQRAFGGEGIDATNAFVVKLKSSGSSLLYSTYLGSEDADGRGIAVDRRGNAYVTGFAGSGFPTTENAFQPGLGGGGPSGDAYVVKLNAKGSKLVFSTYLGGSGQEIGEAITVDRMGRAYVTGLTGSLDFPVTDDAFQPEASGNDEGFVTKLNAKGDALIYSTFLGGNRPDRGFGIAVDRTSSAYVTGHTLSIDFPIKNAFQSEIVGDVAFEDAFVTKLNRKGSALVFSTYLGGSVRDEGFRISVDHRGNAYVTGRTFSTDFPTQKPFQSNPGGAAEAFITKLNPEGSALIFSSYLGGSRDDQSSSIAVDRKGNAYVTGFTDSTDFPTSKEALQPDLGGNGDAFVVKISDGKGKEDDKAAALLNMAEQDAEHAVDMAIQDPDPEVREVALAILEDELVDDPNNEALIERLANIALTDPDPELRMGALGLIADTNPEAALPILELAQNDPNPQVSEFALELIQEREE